MSQNNTDKNKRADTVRVTSIARRINFGYVWHQLISFICVDLILVAVLAAIFVVGMDIQMAGSFSTDYIRQFRLSGDAAYDLNRLQSVWYSVSDKDGNFIYKIHIGEWLYLFCQGGVVVLAVELIDICSIAFKGTRKVRRKLKPLNQIAARAAELSRLAFDETKYHDLENAISKLEADAMENGIHMNDKELRGIETALNGLLERIRASYRQQSQFVSDASHELRTPIAVIQGYVNMLDRWGKEDTEILEESILAIKNEANHMQKLVEQLLFLARGDSNRQNLDMKNHCLNDIMREVYEESLMIDENHIYRFEENGEAAIYGDMNMLKQSARILIDNAAKYTGEGEEIIIKAGVWKDGSPFYQIQDNGIGMAPDDVAHAFDRFYRADSVRNSKTGGTGLGLSIAKWIVDKHNGYYDIVSREGLGTRFSVIFPKAD